MTWFSIFCLGIVWNGKNIVGMSYADEMLPRKHQEDLLTVMFVVGSLIMVLLPIQYMLFTKSWIPTHIISIVMTLIACAFFPFYVPESPKFLYVNNRFDEARKSLYHIAGKNAVYITEDIKFDRENPKLINIYTNSN